VLREDTGLARTIAGGRRALAEDTCTARELTVRRGRWKDVLGDVPEGATLLVLDGLLLRRVSVKARAGAELLGTGDLVRPRPDAGKANLGRATAWRALERSRLAVLDDHALERMAGYPEIVRELLDRGLERSQRLAVHLAIVHQPRVDMRLQMLFWHLADRWGRVRDGRTLLALPLTHTVLADLIAAQRPTVSTVLSDMTSRGIIRPTPDGWLLLASPPDARRRPEEVTGDITGSASKRAEPVNGRARDQTHRRSESRRGRRGAQDISTRPR
jgi:CRP/FNR family transcriptional regulator, cyclic AMP receptor protein